MQRIIVPEIRSNAESFDAIARIAKILQNSKSREVVFDFQRCNFFDGNMTVPLQIAIERFKVCAGHKNAVIDIRFEFMQKDIEDSLRCNNFLTQYGYKPFPSYDFNSLPLRQFHEGDLPEYYRHLDVLVDRIDQPKMTTAVTKELKQNLCEVMVNACEHAKSDVGFFCCMQYAPEQRKIYFTFSDGGVGIRQNVNVFTKQNLTDIAAIKWAVKSGNSTKSRLPGGLGLGIIRKFVEINQGKLCVISGRGFYSVVPSKPRKMLNDCLPGTTIHFEIKMTEAT